MRSPSGQFTNGPSETLKLLLETHFPDCTFVSDESDVSYSNSWPKANREGWALARRIVTLSRVKWAIFKFSPFKSPGGDGVLPALLQHAPDSLHVLLCELFRASLAYGYIPRPWRLCRVTFIPKRGRSDYSLPKSFRPISLSSFFLKTLERLVEMHIRKGVLRGTPLHRNQHAYQPGKSCETALHQLLCRVEDSLAVKEIALCAFMDIEGAFDSTSFEAMGRGVRGRGVEPSICKWISAMLSTRRVMASLHNESVMIAPTKGCPQGGVLSPLLWNLVVDGLLLRLSNEDIFAQSYADDIVLVVQGKYCNIVADRMNVGLRCTHSWCLDEGLTVNPGKTTVVPFTKKKKLESLSRLKLGSTRLKTSMTVKYLGLTLDHGLTWNNHLASALHKARWSLMTTRRLVGTTWGIKPHIALWLYKAIVRPQITYGSLVWWTKVNQSTVQAKLTSLQRLACLLVTGAFTSSPTVTLEVALGLLPLDIFIKEEARKSAYRMTILQHWREGRSETGHRTILRELDCGTVLNMIPDAMVKETTFKKPYSVTICSRERWKEDLSTHLQKGSLVWYTDGSLMDGKSGYGIFSPSPRTAISASLGLHCSIFQAEIYAILACTNMANRHFDRQITILSDSQAALKALDSADYTSKLVWECSQALSTLAARNSVHLHWVPGHEGIEGNECADRLAKSGALTPFLGPEPACGISRSTAFHAIHTKSRELHRQRWKSYPGQTLGKQLIPDTNAHFTKWLVNLSRSQIKLVIALITGHGHFRKHLYTLGIIPENQECRLCNQSEETAKHIILDCDALEVRRRTIFGCLQPGDETDVEIGKKLLNLTKGSGIGLPI